MENKIPKHIRIKIEYEIKKLSKLSTAPDKETPNWLEADIRRGADMGYEICYTEFFSEYEKIKEKNNLLKEAIHKFLTMICISEKASFYYRDAIKLAEVALT